MLNEIDLLADEEPPILEDYDLLATMLPTFAGSLASLAGQDLSALSRGPCRSRCRCCRSSTRLRHSRMLSTISRLVNCLR